MRTRLLTSSLLLAYAGLTASCNSTPPHTDTDPNGPANTQAPSVAEDDSAADSFAVVAQPFLNQFCLNCHNVTDRAGKTDLSHLTAANIAEHAELWRNVQEQVATGTMPTGWGSPKPSAEQRAAFLAWIESQHEAP